MDQETEIRRIKRLGLNLEKLAKEIEENAADCFELDAILKKILKIKQQLEQAYEYFIGIRDTDELLLEIEELTDKYSKLEVKILRFTQHFHNDANLPLSNNAVNKNYANLPKLELSFFDGKLENWISFSNVFKTTIIDNSQLTNIVELQYLKACLKGKALTLVNHIPITENNFVLAWDLLKKRYDNKRDLIFNLIQRIIDLPKITIESSTQLLFLVDNSYEIIRSLETLGYKLDELSDIIIGKILSDKLDKTTKRSCNMTVDNNHIPTCSELLKFIETNAKALNTSETERGLPLIKRSMKLQVHNLTKANCFLCQQEHGIYLCPTFLDMEPIERRKKVKQLKLCFNCLRNNHSVNQCRSEFKCRKCQGKHNTLIHIDANIHQFKEHTVGIPAIEEPDKNQAESSVKENNDALGVTSIHNTTCLMSNQEDSFVLLSTATIMVMNHQGKYQPCRALIDTASQATLITRDCLKKLNLEPSRTRVELAGIGGQILDRPNGVINLNFTSHFNMSRIFKTNALVVDKVTSYMPYLKFEEHQFDHLQGLQLADPQYQYTAPIDILLGADIAFSLFKGAIKYGHEGQPKTIKTLLGWLLFGEIKTFQKKSKNYQKLHTFNCTLNNWEPIFSLWEEELKTKPDPFEDDFNEIHFKTTHERETSGRYRVRLPFKDPSLLGESKPQAINCFLRMEQILKQQPQVYQTYKDFMQEYLVLGHMNEVKGNGNDHKAFYLPHHPIIKEKSSTTKLRVVFNTSSKTTTGYSLNDILHTGPKLQKDIFPLLLRFRSHPIAISADITKMYRQILVHPEDTPYQRIIWRDESGQGLKEYELKTLTYGTSCAPFLAIRVLKQLAHDEQIRFPTAEAILKSDFYVDDLLTGCETVENGRKLIRELDQLLQAGGFKLQQWASNKPTIMDTLQETDKSTFYANADRENTLGINLLGINWNPRNDQIGLRKLEIIKNTPTKRNILSQMAKIYDPLGWFAPVMLKIKLMIQTLWAAKLTWDEPIPVRLQESWKALQNDLASLHQVQIPRWIGLFEPATYQIHGFADASQRAYAAMVYIKIIHNSSIHEVYLLAAKTRVATLKTTTTPRMELCASLLLAQLTRLVCTAMSLNVNKVTLWSDSTIVLSWLASEHNRWKPYVSNRVKDIQELLPCRWMHVKGEDNPADLAFRGTSLNQLLDLELWWHGPPWLKTTSQPYNDAIPVINEKCLSEQRIKTNLFVKRNISYPFITRYSSLNKLKRITGWIFRFFYNCRKLLKREKSGALSIEEIETSFNRIIRCAQQEDYYIELKQLEAFQPLSGKSHLIKLNPFLDKGGLLRVGGRINNALLSFDQKHPIILPKAHYITQLVIRHYHERLLHAGVQLTLSAIREKYWIPSGRCLVKQILFKCIKCARFRTKAVQQLMGNLPTSRTNWTRPFTKTGIDFAGPVIVKTSNLRNARCDKAYIALFICMFSKAIHIELVTNLTTEAFLAALRRFISRRGRPAEINTDNATNFVGAYKDLRKLFNSNIHDFASSEEIKWNFIPPSSPHFGGLWEAGIKSVKYHLRRIVVVSNKEPQMSPCISITEAAALSTILAQKTKMAEYNFLSQTKIEPLTGNNYQIWALKIGAVLRGRKLFKCVISDPEPDMEDKSSWEIWSDKNDEAFGIIITTLTNEQAGMFIGETNAKKVWDSLRKTYTGNLEDKIIDIGLELKNIRMKDNETVDEYITRAKNIAARSSSLRHQFSSREFSFHIVRGIHPRYENIAIVLRSKREATIEEIQQTLREEESRRNMRLNQSVENGHEQAYRIKDRKVQQSQPKRCFVCNKKGHLANDCWFRDKQKQGYQKKWTPGDRNHKYSREHSNNLVDTMKSGINEQAFETYVKEFEDSPDERNDRQIWCIDSGCTAHLTPNLTLMENVVDYESEINLAEKGKTTQAIAKGDMRLTTCTSEGQENICIKDILHVPSLRNNFLSVYELVNKGNSVIFNKDGAKIYNEGNDLVAEAYIKDRMFMMETKQRNVPIAKNENVMVINTHLSNKNSNISLWHKRLNHINEEYMKK
ncbi:hypothetical protein LAZ67_20000761 [Cordylochernes scorpioides]|uniref:Endonuclease n=1 Tax=Cordylochernes scorpioides TaxID=51811 RepID=A0ABY6LNL7_9ARAC|nr:hypothetical protein LAZ67_20000761 [Cordylochernes scorpioides]